MIKSICITVLLSINQNISTDQKVKAAAMKPWWPKSTIVWTPDSKSVIYDKQGEIYKHDTETLQTIKLTDREALGISFYNLSISPDGKWITANCGCIPNGIYHCIYKSDHKAGVYLLDLSADSKPRHFIDGSRPFVAWSADSRTVLFLSESSGEISITSKCPDEKETITKPLEQPKVHGRECLERNNYTFLGYSKDKTSIMLHLSNPSEVYVINTTNFKTVHYSLNDGFYVTLVQNDQLIYTSHSEEGNKYTIYMRSMSNMDKPKKIASSDKVIFANTLSNDESKLYFFEAEYTSNDSSSIYEYKRIRFIRYCSVGLSDLISTQLLDLEGMTKLSHSGSKIAFIKNDKEVYYANATSAASQQLMESSAFKFDLKWSPDLTKIAVLNLEKENLSFPITSSNLQLSAIEVN